MNLGFNEKNPADHPLVMKVTRNNEVQYVMTNLPVCSEYQATEWLKSTHVLFAPVNYDDGNVKVEAYNARPCDVKAFIENGSVPAGCVVVNDKSARAMRVFEFLKRKSF